MAPIEDGNSNAPRQKRWAAKVKTGCLTCRRRRVKCDEAKPFCLNCTKRNLHCAGYQVLDKGKNARSMAVAATAPLCKQRVKLPNEELTALNDVVTLFNLMPHFLLSEAKGEREFTLRAPMRYTTALYLAVLPSRAGHSPVVDTAVTALSAAARLYYDTTISAEMSLEQIEERDDYDRVLCLYNRALHYLREALNDPEESVSSDALCATELLCCFESFNLNSPPEIQVQHLMGSAELIQHRGPERFTSGFDLILLRTQIPYLMFSAFYTNTPSFLNRPEWTAALKTVARLSPDIDRHLVYFMILAGQIFSVLLSINEYMRQIDRSTPEAMEQRKQLLDNITKHGNTFSSWARAAQVKVEQALIAFEATHKDTRHNLYSQSTIATATQFYGASIAVLLLQNRLRISLGCSHAREREEESQDLANKLRERVMADERLGRKVPTFQIAAFNAVLASKDQWMQFAGRVEHMDETQDRAIAPELYFTWLQSVGVRSDLRSVVQKLSVMLPVKSTRVYIP